MPSLIDSGVGEIISKAIDKIFPDKNAALAAKTQLAQLANEGELDELNNSYKAIIAEAQSADKWTSRARPSFMYVMYAIILSAIPMGILTAINPQAATNITIGFKGWLNAIPDYMWGVFGTAYVGYSVSRSYDKHMEKKYSK